MLLIIYNEFVIVFNKSVNVLSFSVLISNMVPKKKKKKEPHQQRFFGVLNNS